VVDTCVLCPYSAEVRPVRRRALAAVGAVLIALTVSASAAAAPRDDAARAPTLTMPTLLSEPAAPYPEGEHGEANVVVAIVLNRDGSVRTVSGAGAGPAFVAAAERAALTWKFTPARRGTAPVAATIRVLVHFEQREQIVAAPEVQVATAPVLAAAAPSSPSSTAAKLPPPPPEDVTIKGRVLPSPIVQTIARAEVRLLPGAFGDPFRAIEALPGVTPTVSGLPFFYVRGAPPSNVGYYLDGVRVPYLFHFGLGPSVINPALVDRVDLYRGAFPAEYGRYAGAIVAATTTEPRSKFGAEGSLRLFDVGGLAELPFADGRGHVLVGGRFSYTSALLSLLAPDIGLSYGDYQARVSYRVSSRDELRLMFLGAYDVVSQFEKDQRRVIFASEFHRQDLRFRRRFQAGGGLEANFTAGVDRTRIDGKRFARSLLFSMRTKVEYPVAAGVTFRGGADVIRDAYTADLPSIYAVTEADYVAAQSLYRTRVDAAIGAHTELQLRLGPRLTITPGIRADLFGSFGNAEAAVDVRLTGQLKLTQFGRLLFGFGTAHQPTAFPVPVPATQPAGIPGGLQTSAQSSATLEWDLPASLTAQVGGFVQSFRKVSDADTRTDASPFEADPERARAGGYAIGMEAMLRRRFTRRLGFIGIYTLSRNMRSTAAGLVPSPFDRTHVFSVAASYDLGKGYRAGARFLAYSGWPQIELQRRTLDGRLPMFTRVDVRLEKRWSFAQSRWISVVLEGLNVTLAKEALSQTCTTDGCKVNYFGPLSIPSLSLEGAL
jgi:TonB-dependent Receptor Plug Domain/TonB dependent receptor/Gram-negative bacterial TonB protein C-terminal